MDGRTSLLEKGHSLQFESELTAQTISVLWGLERIFVAPADKFRPMGLGSSRCTERIFPQVRKSSPVPPNWALTRTIFTVTQCKN